MLKINHHWTVSPKNPGFLPKTGPRRLSSCR